MPSVCVCESPLLTFKRPNQSIWNFVCIHAPEHISVAYLINPFHQSVCMCMRSIVARRWLGKHVPAATNTRNSMRIVGRLCLCILLSLLGINSVKTFPRQRRIIRGVVFFEVRVVSKESRRLVLTRTCCCYYFHIHTEYGEVLLTRGQCTQEDTTLCCLADCVSREIRKCLT
jgi:hypothetical protein